MQIRILVVDDEPDNCDYLKLVLEKEGYQVDTLTDPTQCVPAIRKSDYHLIVLDMMMPGMSGTEVLQEIRKVDTDVAVIVATAYPAVETAVASLKAAASDYVKKPIEVPAFLSTVQAALAKKGLSKDPEADLHRAIGQTIRD